MEGRERSCLHPYLIKYAVYYFDHTYADGPLDETIREFMGRRKFWGLVRPSPAMAVEEALRLFKFSVDEFKRMSRKQLVARYRRKAMKRHPDRGGDHEDFIRLTEAYEVLLAQKC
jgi:hypothetical protein